MALERGREKVESVILLSRPFSASKIARLKPFVKRVSRVSKAVSPVFPSVKPETDANPELERLTV